LGEILHINTGMDELWFDQHFTNKKLYHKGVCGEFRVTDVQRYCKNIWSFDKFEHTKIPTQNVVEVFEIHLEKV
jgi:hypothetical protein